MHKTNSAFRREQDLKRKALDDADEHRMINGLNKLLRQSETDTIRKQVNEKRLRIEREKFSQMELQELHTFSNIAAMSPRTPRGGSLRLPPHLVYIAVCF